MFGWFVCSFVRIHMLTPLLHRYECPTHRASRISYAFVRWLLSLRALSIVTYAGGNSCLSPAERPHAVFGRAVAGSPIGFVDEPESALAEVGSRFFFVFSVLFLCSSLFLFLFSCSLTRAPVLLILFYFFFFP